MHPGDAEAWGLAHPQPEACVHREDANACELTSQTLCLRSRHGAVPRVIALHLLGKPLYGSRDSMGCAVPVPTPRMFAG